MLPGRSVRYIWKLLCSMLIICVHTSVYAQQKTYTGKIVDQNGEPVIGANIQIINTTRGTITDLEGKFAITASGGDNIRITAIGFKKVQIPVSDISPEKPLVMKEDIKNLSEVVIVGYGKENVRSLTGNVAVVKGKDIQAFAPTVNFDAALQGRAAGVLVSQQDGAPGSATKIRIRGSSSLLGSNQPLYVIDGIPIAVSSNIPFNNGAINERGVSTPAGNINPDDIESISILKDASASAIYGSRAANGVILITTKKGHASQKPSFNFNFSTTFQRISFPSLLNTQQFKELWTEAVRNSGRTSRPAERAILDGSYFGNADTRWIDEITPKGNVTTNANLSVQGGTKKTTYYTSVGLRDQTGTIEDSFFKRYSLTTKVESAITKKFTLKTYINLSSTNQRAIPGGLVSRIYSFRPDLPVYDSAGNYTFDGFRENPVALNTSRTNITNLGLITSLEGSYEIIKNLKIRSRLYLTEQKTTSKTVNPGTTRAGGFSRGTLGGGLVVENTSTSSVSIFEVLAEYQKNFLNAQHEIAIVLGSNWQSNNSSAFSASGRNFPNHNRLANLSSATTGFQTASLANQSGLSSYFSKVNYGFRDKYFLVLAARVDGSSKFGKNARYATFPTFAVAWRLSEEPFLKRAHFLDNLKLRASYGITGKQDFGPYASKTLFASANYNGISGVSQSQLGNENLKWETTQQLDVGLTFSLFKGRLSGEIAFYTKNTKDLLYFAKVPRSTGFSSVISNLGDVENKGMEIQLGGDIIRRKDFSWNLSFNLANNRNKLVKLNDDFLDNNGFIDPPNTGSRLKVGEPMGLIHGYQVAGIFQTQEEINALNAAAPRGVYQARTTAPGDFKFKDISGPEGIPDGRVNSDDRTIIGKSQPDWYGGINTTWNYKGFTLSALFTYSIGNDLFWNAESRSVSYQFLVDQRLSAFLDRWTPNTPNAKYPRAVYLDPNRNVRVSDYFVHDASFIRLANLRLAYNFPRKLLEKTKFFKSISMYVTGTNVFTITEYPGPNPVASNLFDNDVSSGFDNGLYPPSKQITVGLGINF